MFGLGLTLITKFPFLIKIGNLFKNPKTWLFIGLIAGSMFLYVTVKGIINDKIESEVDTFKNQVRIEQLETQNKINENNHKVVNEVDKETTIIIKQQEIKAEQIKEKIDEEVKIYGDSYVDPIITNTINRM